MSKNEEQHPASCPCPKCARIIEDANKSQESEIEQAPDARLRKLTPEQAKTLGYVPEN